MTAAEEWQAEVTDPQERRIFEALSDARGDFRTAEGLARATGLTAANILAVIKKYPHLIRRSIVPDNHGRALYTLRSRPVSIRERLAEARLFISKSA
jgi:hypothetical protein